MRISDWSSDVCSSDLERDLANGLSLPPRLSARGFIGMAARPRWSLSALFGRKFDFVNVAHRVAAMADGPTSLHDYVNGQFDRTLTWKDVEWRSEEHTSELQSLMRISYAVFCLKKNNKKLITS